MGLVSKSVKLLKTDPGSLPATVRKWVHRKAALDYRLGRTAQVTLPRAVTFEVTGRCNLRCKMCDLYGSDADVDSPRKSGRPQDHGEMTVDDWKTLADSLAPSRPTISFTGGEPLLVKGIVEVIRHVKRLGMTATMTTNGTLLERHAAQLVDSGIDNVTVSIDGPEKVHEAIRGIEGCFGATCRGVEALMAEREHRGSATPRLQVNSTITGSNYDALNEIVPIAQRLGAFKHVFSHLWFWTAEMAEAHNKLYAGQWGADAQNLGGLEGMDVERLIEEVRRIRRSRSAAEVEFVPEIDEEDIRTYYNKPAAPIKTRCRAPWMAIRVLPNGDVMPCLDLVLGNVREASFEDLWRGDKMSEFRQALLDKGLFPACTRCCWLFSY